MSVRKLLLGFAGAAALSAAALIFMAGPEFGGGWVRWVFGPLLWFLGCAMLITWGALMAYSEAEKTEEQERREEAEHKAAVKKAS